MKISIPLPSQTASRGGDDFNLDGSRCSAPVEAIPMFTHAALRGVGG